MLLCLLVVVVEVVPEVMKLAVVSVVAAYGQLVSHGGVDCDCWWRGSGVGGAVMEQRGYLQSCSWCSSAAVVEVVEVARGNGGAGGSNQLERVVLAVKVVLVLT